MAFFATGAEKPLLDKEQICYEFYKDISTASGILSSSSRWNIDIELCVIKGTGERH